MFESPDPIIKTAKPYATEEPYKVKNSHQADYSNFSKPKPVKTNSNLVEH